ncbi:MAG TPA: PIN domain-containing protein [Candidatus Acidoferrales bacterium]|nr:PIN domain-containing protein [Candidatus Acidoferrales bacterium]
MAVKVLDSWALIAFFEDEPAAEEVEKLLVKAEAGAHQLLLSVVNWGEIYYNTMREVSQAAAEQTAREMAGLTIQIVGVDAANLDLVRQAAVYKATRRFSYADAFAAALAKIKNAELVTGDREFRAVEDEIRIAWLE